MAAASRGRSETGSARIPESSAAREPRAGKTASRMRVSRTPREHGASTSSSSLIMPSAPRARVVERGQVVDGPGHHQLDVPVQPGDQLRVEEGPVQGHTVHGRAVLQPPLEPAQLGPVARRQHGLHEGQVRHVLHRGPVPPAGQDRLVAASSCSSSATAGPVAPRRPLRSSMNVVPCRSASSSSCSPSLGAAAEASSRRSHRNGSGPAGFRCRTSSRPRWWWMSHSMTSTPRAFAPWSPARELPARWAIASGLTTAPSAGGRADARAAG